MWLFYHTRHYRLILADYYMIHKYTSIIDYYVTVHHCYVRSVLVVYKIENTKQELCTLTFSYLTKQEKKTKKSNFFCLFQGTKTSGYKIPVLYFLLLYSTRNGLSLANHNVSWYNYYITLIKVQQYVIIVYLFYIAYHVKIYASLFYFYFKSALYWDLVLCSDVVG